MALRVCRQLSCLKFPDFLIFVTKKEVQLHLNLQREYNEPGSVSHDSTVHIHVRRETGTWSRTKQSFAWLVYHFIFVTSSMEDASEQQFVLYNLFFKVPDTRWYD